MIEFITTQFRQVDCLDRAAIAACVLHDCELGMHLGRRGSAMSSRLEASALGFRMTFSM
ncbi:hypothetical protein N7E70_022415 [Aminobacter sp. NyZ550]|uniref:hypothetical protein n=1 Tax=Aminobacter sp. NyZ550 TaxID=2979870 RepID=UPI0021D60FB4|nr:hypothetical protein [Aminobacter sp. NyZ550]WAX94397.1 hypothetical protein N7E70_022415 [Aminobacter sp. NyZ550]